MEDLNNQFYSLVRAEGGSKVLIAKIIWEWYPEIFSTSEFDEALEILNEYGLVVVDKSNKLVGTYYTKKIRRTQKPVKVARSYNLLK